MVFGFQNKYCSYLKRYLDNSLSLHCMVIFSSLSRKFLESYCDTTSVGIRVRRQIKVFLELFVMFLRHGFDIGSQICGPCTYFPLVTKNWHIECSKIPNPLTLWGDKVSMLTHIYPHKPWREIEVTICKITRLTAHFMCGLMSDLLICTCL